MVLQIPNDGEFADVALVVGSLVTKALVDSNRLLLVGARCRDLLHRELGHRTANRRTDDIDLGIAVESLSDYRKIVETFEPSGTTGARVKIDGQIVDIMPFGPIEQPSGTVTLGSRYGSFSVEGFRSVWKEAQTVQLDQTVEVRVPRAAGYAVLKAHAYAERAARFETKDAEDLATVLTWYRTSLAVEQELFGSDFGNAVLEETDFDVTPASAYILGVDMLQSLPPSGQAALRRSWNQCRDDLLIERYSRQSRSVDAAGSVRSLRRAMESAAPGIRSSQAWPI